MFSMRSELTPRARIPDTRKPQLMQPYIGFASDIDQTNISRDIRDGNWLSRLEPYDTMP